MSFIKRILGNHGNGHHGGNRKSSHGQKNHNNDYSFNNEPQGVPCPKCQIYNAPGARFCGQCGQGMQNSACACGASVAAGAKFCGQCGKSI